MAIRLRVWQHGEPQGALEPGDVLLPTACGRLGAKDYRKNIMGTASLKGTAEGPDLTSQDLKDVLSNWEGRAVAPGWDGRKGFVCVDVVTDPKDGLGGKKLRDEMAKDFVVNGTTYPAYLSKENKEIKPQVNRDFYRRTPMLLQFFKNTNRYVPSE